MIGRVSAAAVMLAYAVSLWAANKVLLAGRGFQPAPSAVISGDEPHYMLMAQSLLYDHSVDPAGAYRRLATGARPLGLVWQRESVDHQTVVIDDATGRAAMWNDLFDHVRGCQLPAVCDRPRPGAPAFVAAGRFREVPAHPILFPMLLAAAAWPFHPDPLRLERLANKALQLAALLGAALVYLAARGAGMSRGWSIAAFALLAWASPWLAYSRSYFPDLLIGFVIIGGVWLLQRGNTAAATLLAVIALMLKPVFVVVGLGWAIERALSRRYREAAIILAVELAGGCALLLINWVLFHYLFINGSNEIHPVLNLWAQLLDRRHGLMVFVPWTLLAFAGLLTGVFSRAPENALLRLLAFTVLPYAALLAATDTVGGWSVGPRLWICVVPCLALAAVEWTRRRVVVFRWALLGLGFASAAIAIPLALDYGHLFHAPVEQTWQPLLTSAK